MSRSRVVAALVTPVLAGLFTVGVTPAGAASTDPDCPADLVGSLVYNGEQAATDFSGGFATDLAAAWAHCQFRFYDDNDGKRPDKPEVPHVFSEDDWFLGGLFFWLTPSELDLLGVSPREGVDLQKQIVERLYFGKSGSALIEIPLRESSYQDFVFDPEEGPVRINQSYHIFRPGSLPPGTYEWRYEQTLPMELDVLFPGEARPFVAHGVVQIIAG